HSDCLAAASANEASTSTGSARTRFLWQLEKARALAGTGEPTLAMALLAEAKDMLAGLGDYEPVEWSEAERDIELLSRDGAGITAVSGTTAASAADAGLVRQQNLIARYQRDGLHEREADERVELAQAFSQRGDLANAVSEAAAALA